MSSSSTFQKPLRLKGRLRLTTKQVNGGYYKGNNTGSMGFFGSRKGEYIIDYRKVRTYVYPATMEQCKLTPFVTKEMTPTRSKYIRFNPEADGTLHHIPRLHRRMNGKDYVDMWSRKNEMEYNRVYYGQSEETDANENEATGGEEADESKASELSENSEK